MATTVQLRMNASFWLDGNVRITAQFIEGMMTSIRELHGATIIYCASIQLQNVLHTHIVVHTRDPHSLIYFPQLLHVSSTMQFTLIPY